MSNAHRKWTISIIYISNSTVDLGDWKFKLNKMIIPREFN